MGTATARAFDVCLLREESETLLDTSQRYLQCHRFLPLAFPPPVPVFRYETLLRSSMSGTSGDGVEIGEHFGGNLQPGSIKILAKMLEGRGSGDQQDVGRALEKPG